VLFPRWPEREVPVSHVTNGVHVPTWESPDAAKLWAGVCGADRWMGDTGCLEADFRKLNDAQLWQLRMNTTKGLIEYTRTRLARQWGTQGASEAEIAEAERIFDINTLTLGFARRFATYKRPNLLLEDPERLIRILNHPQWPVQLILAGKAHPQDLSGQAMIQQWNEFIRRPEVRNRVVFLSDYDMLLTQQLVQGVDVWINTPRRPWEASGTSGMKVLVNGGVNLSELDGWWAEAYAPDLGWALGDRREHDDDPAWDRAEAEALYELLEREVVPAFYQRDEHGIARAWVAKMRESMARLTPQFSANRTVHEYTEKHYIPAAAAYCRRASDNGRFGAELLEWKRGLATHWANLRFGGVQVETHDHAHAFEVQVYLDELDPEAVRVELYAEPRDAEEPSRIPMTRGAALVGAMGGYLYTATIPATRPAGDYTPRMVPFKEGALVPLEASQILWQR
jgi:glycogen phosphorylase